MWANKMLLAGKGVLFIQYQMRKACQVWILEGDQILRLTSPGLDPSNLVDVVKSVLARRSSAKPFDICICDGIRQTDAVSGLVMGVFDAMSGKKLNSKISKLVLVSSMQFEISDGDEATGINSITPFCSTHGERKSTKWLF
jgi:hypothetical protein